MAKQLQLRRGTTSQHSTFTGANGEVTIDTDKKVLVVHDGATVGGIPLAKQATVDTKVDKITSTNNTLPKFNGTTGALQNSGIIEDANGNIVLASGSKIQGDFSNATLSNRTTFQTKVTNGATIITAIPNGTNTFTSVMVKNNNDDSNYVFGQIANRNDSITIDSSKSGTANNVPLKLGISGSYPLVIGTDLSVLVQTPTGLGYGIGAGGIVTQATSKSTAVTLNKPTGRITMNNASLAANTAITFQFTNSLIGASDNVLIHLREYGGSTEPYIVTATTLNVGGGAFITLINRGAVSLSEAVQLEFSVIKGATA